MKNNVITMEAIASAAVQFGVSESVAIRIVCQRAEMEGVEVAPEVAVCNKALKTAEEETANALTNFWEARESMRRALSPSSYDFFLDKEHERLNDFLEKTSHISLNHLAYDGSDFAEDITTDEGKFLRPTVDSDVVASVKEAFKEYVYSLEDESLIVDKMRKKAVRLAYQIGRAKRAYLMSQITLGQETLDAMSELEVAKRSLKASSKALAKEVADAFRNETPISL